MSICGSFWSRLPFESQNFPSVSKTSDWLHHFWNIPLFHSKHELNCGTFNKLSIGSDTFHWFWNIPHLLNMNLVPVMTHPGGSETFEWFRHIPLVLVHSKDSFWLCFTMSVWWDGIFYLVQTWHLTSFHFLCCFNQSWQRCGWGSVGVC